MHWKKLCAIFLTITVIVCTQSVFIPQDQCIVANAAEYYIPDPLVSSYIKRAEEHLAEIESDFAIAASGQAGLLAKLDDIQRYGMTLYYFDYYRSSLNLQGVTDTNSEIKFYTDKFIGMCKIFDSNFGDKSTSYTALKLGVAEDNCNTDKTLRKTIKGLCTNTIPTYLSTLLQDTKNASSSLDITKTTANYGVFLSNICMVLNNMEDMSDDLTNISPFLSQVDVTNTIDFDTKLNTSKAYASLRADYANLLDIGNDVLQMTGTTSVLSIDTSIGYVANMANVTENSGNIIIPNNVQLSQAYLAILSAGSTYVPFSSYVGDSSFISALKSLVSDPTSVDPLVNFYDDTKSFRKPLYRRALSNEGVPTGKAELITVSEFLADIESGAEAALVTVSGKFTYDTNNNYWVYADTYSTNNDNETITNRTESESFVDSANESLESDGLTPEEASGAIEEVHGDLGKIQKTVGANDAGELLYVAYQSSESSTTATYEFSMSSSKCTLTYDKGNGDAPISKSELFVIQKPGTAILSIENDLDVPVSMRFTNDPDFVDFCNQSNGSYNDTVTNLINNATKFNVGPISNVSTAIDAIKNLFSNDSSEDTGMLPNIKVHAAEVEIDNTTIDLEDPSDDVTVGGENGTGDKENSTGDGEGGTVTTTTTVNVVDTVDTTIDTSQLSGMSIASKDVVGLMADRTITSEDKISEPIMLYGAKHARATDNLTTILMRNILKGTVGYDNLYNESNDYLYVNAYGDILTDDGMIILPGIANPIMYADSAKYNPYTAAFMNYYPTVLDNTNFFQVSAERDIGKMIILNKTSEILEDGSIDPDSLVTNKANIISSICDIKTSAPLTVPEFETTFYFNEVDQQQLLGYTRLIFGDSATWSAYATGMYAFTPLLIKSQLSSGGVPVFPYNADDDRNYKEGNAGDNLKPYSCAEIIAQNMFHFLVTDSSGQQTNLSRLNDNYIVYYFCVSNLNGTSNPLAYANDDTYSYDRYVNDTENRSESSLLELSRRLVRSLGHLDQIIGIKTSAQSSILGPTFAFIKKNWFMSFMLLIVILLFGFARIRHDGFQTIVLLTACVGFSYLFVYVLPTYLPLAYNSAINNISESLAYQILAVKTENNDINQVNSVALDESGNYAFNTSSLNLYRVGTEDLSDFYNGLGITETDVVGGRSYIINQEAGLFVEGDIIKINTDILFDTLEITGSMDATSSNYYLSSNKTVSNNVDYYTPYYSFVKLFIGKLNSLTEVYAIPRSVTKYSENVLKDNYLVYSYVNSMPFLTPGIYDSYTPEDLAILSSEELSLILEREKELSDILTQTFGDENTAADWLGIADFFYNLDYDYRQTLWAQTMYDCGYYYHDSETDTDWVPNEEKINDLCNYVNRQVKHFVFNMEDQIGALSDDTMIKIITLRELTAFTQYISEMGHWLYPYSLNYSEMNMLDVLNCILVDDYYTFVSKQLDVCSYVLDKYGWMHLILFDALVIFLFVVCTVVHFVVPVMYLLLGILLIIKILSNSDIKVPVKGYFKCTIITMLCSTLLCIGIVLTSKWNDSVLCLYFLTAIVLLTATVLTTILSSLIGNIADFGNTALNAKLESIQSTFNKYSNRTATTTILTGSMNKIRGAAKNTRAEISDLVSKYSNDRSVDDFYDDSPQAYDYYSDPRFNGYDEDDYDYFIEPEVIYSNQEDYQL